jgi:FKBP-type peptidyl-prolyl cis-trans isomerase FklB
MRTILTTATLILWALTASSSATPILNKGQDLDTLDAQVNYLSSKNICLKIQAMKFVLLKQPFLLGAFDVRDKINLRVPENSFNGLLEILHKKASPLLRNTKEPETENENLPSGLRTAEERVSYLTAVAIAKNFGKNGIPILPASMLLGLADSQSADTLKISADEEKIILNTIKEKTQKNNNDWAENRKHYYTNEEQQFLAENITQPNVVSLDSGVQYRVIKLGSGKIPNAKNTVKINYKGSLLDGTEFDSSYKRNKPDTFKLSAMILGFTQALTQVPEGSRIIMYIPARLAYGEKGDELIPPFAALVFEVELLSVK